MATTINGTTGVSQVQDDSITPEKLVQKMTLMTAKTATGTAVDFTGIPSWAKRVTVMFNGVSTNGTSSPIIQVGHAGGVETTGYLCSSGNLGAQANYTAGFGIMAGSTAVVLHGVLQMTLLSGTTWVSSHSVGRSDSSTFTAGGGSKSLSNTLDRIRITTNNGTDQFDAGTINVMYEG